MKFIGYLKHRTVILYFEKSENLKIIVYIKHCMSNHHATIWRWECNSVKLCIRPWKYKMVWCHAKCKQANEKKRMQDNELCTSFVTIRFAIRSLKYWLIDSPKRLHKLSCSVSLKGPWPKCLKRLSRKLFDKAPKHRSDCIRTCSRTCAHRE